MSTHIGARLHAPDNLGASQVQDIAVPNAPCNIQHSFTALMQNHKTDHCRRASPIKASLCTHACKGEQKVKGLPAPAGGVGLGVCW